MEQFTMRDFFIWEVISVNRRRNREVRPRLKSQQEGSLSWLLWATGAHATRIHKSKCEGPAALPPEFSTTEQEVGASVHGFLSPTG